MMLTTRPERGPAAARHRLLPLLCLGLALALSYFLVQRAHGAAPRSGPVGAKGQEPPAL
jgi:hypothetical protein